MQTLLEHRRPVTLPGPRRFTSPPSHTGGMSPGGGVTLPVTSGPHPSPVPGAWWLWKRRTHNPVATMQPGAAGASPSARGHSSTRGAVAQSSACEAQTEPVSGVAREPTRMACKRTGSFPAKAHVGIRAAGEAAGPQLRLLCAAERLPQAPVWGRGRVRLLKGSRLQLTGAETRSFPPLLAKHSRASPRYGPLRRSPWTGPPEDRGNHPLPAPRIHGSWPRVCSGSQVEVDLSCRPGQVRAAFLRPLLGSGIRSAGATAPFERPLGTQVTLEDPTPAAHGGPQVRTVPFKQT